MHLTQKFRGILPSMHLTQKLRGVLPSMLGSPSSSDRMYLLRNRVQKLKKYHRAK